MIVDSVVEVSGRVAGAAGRCPDCGTSSSSCHSRYVRTLSDLPISGAMVELRLSVRRFRCKQRACHRITCTEGLPASLGRRHGRRVARCDELAHAVGLALGGRPGSRMMARLAAPWSKDTLPRAVRHKAAVACPRQLGDGDRHRRLRLEARPRLRQHRHRPGAADGHRHPAGSAE
ncbi:transposase family protein [uncultured Amaricoccus sp.]|uniref:transposase family protein n=1 Tax=uncultured Amaricoccus sp. TaxID=339341 RepID=UPI00263676E9|nr:transposase family protein [uncultured Amaricoccus sp.]